MTVQNGRCRDGGWEDAAGRWKGGRSGTVEKEDAAGRCHRTSVILDITKRKVQGNP